MTPQFQGNENDPVKPPQDVVRRSRESLMYRVLQQALTQVQVIEAGISQVAALTKIASSLAQMGQEERALTALQIIQTPADRASVLAHVIPHLTEPWKSQALDLALSWAQDIENSNRRAMALAYTTPYFPEPLRCQVAEQVLTEVEGMEYPFDILLRIVPYLHEASFPRVLLIAMHSNITAPLPRTLAALALRVEEPFRQQILAQALTATHSIVKHSRTEIDALSDSRPKVLALKEVLTALAQSGQMESALLTVQMLANTAVRAQVLAVLALSVEEPQKRRILDQALVFAQSHEDAYARANTLIEIAPSWTEPTKHQIFEQALVAAQSIKNVYDQQSALSAVVPYLSLAARRRALTTARAIRNAIAGVWVLTAIAPYFPASQQQQIIAQALEAAHVLTHPYYRNNALQKVVSSLAEVGQLEQAFVLAQTIEDQTSQTLALANIISSLLQWGYGDTDGSRSNLTQS